MATKDTLAADSRQAPVSSAVYRRVPRSPTQNLSKRDKKRQMLADRLAALSEKFSHERDQVYREQLHRIQVDTNLVMRVDAYADRPFDALEEEYRQHSLGLGDENRPGPRTLLEMAGPRFQDWIHQLQDLVEERDYYLTKYMADFEKKAQEHNNTYLYKIETANREHKALAQTLRDRLINAITSKRSRLNREKEALEISDASALLLHPNQFSLTNPSSPGATHGKRATRLRRDMDDISGLGDSKKRKRNIGEDDGSPAPQRRGLDPANSTPLWQGDRLSMRKTTGPVYSIDKLFTDKELAMTYNAAAIAAHKHILLHRPRLDENGQIVSTPSGSDSGSGDNDEDGAESLHAVAMERNVSHATRSARGAPANFTDDKLLGLEGLANFDFPRNFQKMLGADPKLPPTFPSTYVKGHTKQSDFNTPTALSQDEASGDVMVINVLKQYDQQHGKGSNLESPSGSRSILEAVARPARENQYVAFLQGHRPVESDIRTRLGLPASGPSDTKKSVMSSVHDGGTPSKSGRGDTPIQSPARGFGSSGPTSVPSAQIGIGGIPMSRQSSASGAPMSRSSSRKGRSTRAG
ncbi:hypothetical protein VTK73DRAFT_66 [Phialemonium thermophilum]|uniref:Deacetylase complex subunit Sds3 n=1 Tax=Phialemonium thermophilum TaxID=223376 RepID=A0ABR3Y7W0_9PEZI